MEDLGPSKCRYRYHPVQPRRKQLARKTERSAHSGEKGFCTAACRAAWRQRVEAGGRPQPSPLRPDQRRRSSETCRALLTPRANVRRSAERGKIRDLALAQRRATWVPSGPNIRAAGANRAALGSDGCGARLCRADCSSPLSSLPGGRLDSGSVAGRAVGATICCQAGRFTAPGSAGPATTAALVLALESGSEGVTPTRACHLDVPWFRKLPGEYQRKRGCSHLQYQTDTQSRRRPTRGSLGRQPRWGLSPAKLKREGEEPRAWPPEWIRLLLLEQHEELLYAGVDQFNITAGARTGARATPDVRHSRGRRRGHCSTTLCIEYRPDPAAPGALPAQLQRQSTRAGLSHHTVATSSSASERTASCGLRAASGTEIVGIFLQRRRLAPIRRRLRGRCRALDDEHLVGALTDDIHDEIAAWPRGALG
ncbi:hypothetical protein PHYPSEUDO_005634 [Phytophthora pseudosyringae]|uniref:Uncharacterized protein n=1 Tax=Phytophthora pseudosyringae TaxID=221518 RepID=A0A8T1VKM0_9STRA|nr:hypothetical protein PHYPSEUDO_005634 [Phytophthora pseudosyringae]